MTVEAALVELKRRGLYVSWICQGTDGVWICTVRRSTDMPFSNSRARTEYVRRGKGKEMVDAILDAVPKEAFEDLGL